MKPIPPHPPESDMVMMERARGRQIVIVLERRLLANLASCLFTAVVASCAATVSAMLRRPDHIRGT